MVLLSKYHTRWQWYPLEQLDLRRNCCNFQTRLELLYWNILDPCTYLIRSFDYGGQSECAVVITDTDQSWPRFIKSVGCLRLNIELLLTIQYWMSLELPVLMNLAFEKVSPIYYHLQGPLLEWGRISLRLHDCSLRLIIWLGCATTSAVYFFGKNIRDILTFPSFLSLTLVNQGEENGWSDLNQKGV